ncbi:MAG: Holliday junction branch migration protein RuvA [Sandaracinaceae bacterium]|nr:Holliday junction branch migration protein RuvA [Sandaracinaceae bacterium]
MIGRLRGQIVERSLDGTAVLEVGGVGYEVLVPLQSLARLPGPPAEVVLHVHTHVREDAFTLFGFATHEDRAAFRTLMTVSSIGPKLALGILSHLDARTLAAAIAREDRKTLQGVPGVGKKLVDRLVLELKDKLGFASAGVSGAGVSGAGASITSGGTVIAPVALPGLSGPLGTVATMLVSMGFRSIEADRAVAAIAPTADGKTVEQLLREALSATA